MKNKLAKENLDIQALFQNVSDQEKKNKTLKAEIKKNQMSSMIQETFLKKVQTVSNKFEAASSNLNFIKKKEKPTSKLFLLVEFEKIFFFTLIFRY